MKAIPFFDLKNQNKFLKNRLDRVWRQALTDREYILGKQLGVFEKNFAQLIGSRYAVGVSSGLDALTLSLLALGVGPGDEVIVPANTFIATALAVSSAGARPIFCDVDAKHLLMELRNIEPLLTSKTRAVIPVHLYGQPVFMKPLLDFCQKKRLAVVEDACQAHGAAIQKTRCGNFGDTGCFSFYPGKNLGAFGDGGLVTTNRRDLYERILLLRNYGSVVKYRHLVKGYNMRLDTLQAGILNTKLPFLDQWNKRRNALARCYERGLRRIRQIVIPADRKNCTAVYHLYVIRTSAREALKKFLEQNGVHTSIHYPVPIHLQEAYKDLGHRIGDFPVSERVSNELLSLPMYPEMPPKDADRIVSLIRDFFLNAKD